MGGRFDAAGRVEAGTLVERVMYSGMPRVGGQMYLRTAFSSRFVELAREWDRERAKEGGSERRALLSCADGY